MIDQIGLHADIAREKMRAEMLGELMLAMKQVMHDPFLDANDGTGLKSFHREALLQLACKGALSKKATGQEMGDYRFLAACGYYSELYFAALDVENRTGRVTLREDRFAASVFAPGFSRNKLVQRTPQVECGHLIWQRVSCRRMAMQLLRCSRRH